MTEYTPGTLVRVSAAWTIASVATDPTAVTLRYRLEGAAETTILYPAAGITKDSTGNYHADLTLTTPGTWHYRWEGTGAAAAAGEGTFRIVSTYLGS